MAFLAPAPISTSFQQSMDFPLSKFSPGHFYCDASTACISPRDVWSRCTSLSDMPMVPPRRDQSPSTPTTRTFAESRFVARMHDFDIAAETYTLAAPVASECEEKAEVCEEVQHVPFAQKLRPAIPACAAPAGPVPVEAPERPPLAAPFAQKRFAMRLEDPSELPAEPMAAPAPPLGARVSPVVCTAPPPAAPSTSMASSTGFAARRAAAREADFSDSADVRTSRMEPASTLAEVEPRKATFAQRRQMLRGIGEVAHGAPPASRPCGDEARRSAPHRAAAASCAAARFAMDQDRMLLF
mmetsp:Transcript_11461/g.32802  ORF Transcript_11461/g.32802 Transcript_11461/m.32802 type:complete len:298 (-) Transcript_11461:174-1067(-)